MAFVDDLLERLKREEAQGPLNACRVVEILCREWSGMRVYVTKRPSPEIGRTDTPQTVQQRHAVSRRTAYNWVSGWRR